jgi:single-strand DNA-binding protein
MNTINLTGNICNDLEVKSTQNGKSVLSFNLAVKRPFTKDTTDFIPVVAWDQRAEYLGKYGHKGDKVAISGKLTTRKWQDSNGGNRVAYEVVADSAELIGSKNDSQQMEASRPINYIPDAYKSSQMPKFEDVNKDLDLPFN